VAGKVALVSGAASGIGQATAVTLAAQGAAVFCADLNLEGAEAVAASIMAAGGTAWSCPLDVTSELSWRGTMDQVHRTAAALDIVVNCAGIAAASPVADTSLDEWRRVMGVNLEGVFLGTKHAIRLMRQVGRGGSIVNVSSVSGVKSQPNSAAYCTSKAGVIMFSKTAALECLRSGDKIRVNVVSPGGVKTPLWRTMPFFQDLMASEGGEEQAFKAMESSAPHSRFALPEEIALAILYLASDESLYVNGANLIIDNGDAQ
jgi:NAD(P)-dependent dehydrogenase (short-subunit alcohol dehydrogenase family)